jgi:asparagine synthase (glutamine-hydrolysing)
LGAFLSGGIDSTAIIALMQEASSRPVRTFSIGSTESAYDEAPFAAAVARHLGTDHTELRVSPAEALAIVPELPAIYDEPFADSSQIPTVLVARMARRHVTVALSGDAGDEVFGGYNRYVFAPKVWALAGRWPHFARAAAAAAIVAIPPSGWDRIHGLVARSIGQGGVRLVGEKLHKLARALPAASQRELYERLASCWIESPVLDGPQGSQQRWYSVPEQIEGSDRFVDLMMYLDFVTYLPDDILVKVDRACMSTSLESRVPMLDHRLVEFMGRLPAGHKVSAKGSKPILRDIAYSRVPRELLERPKMGFGVPIDVWLRGPLRDWAEDLLSPSRITADGFFDAQAVRDAWQQHLAGRRARHHELWTVLMFQAWMERERGA